MFIQRLRHEFGYYKICLILIQGIFTTFSSLSFVIKIFESLNVFYQTCYHSVVQFNDYAFSLQVCTQLQVKHIKLQVNLTISLLFLTSLSFFYQFYGLFLLRLFFLSSIVFFLIYNKNYLILIGTKLHIKILVYCYSIEENGT